VNDVYELHQGSAPLLISLPHDGTAIPEAIAAHMHDWARRVPDTDWHVATLYDFARTLGASILVPRYSRYVIDLNRPPDGGALYPGRTETGLCPSIGFNGEPIYREGHAPDAEEIERRRLSYWQPYHHALAQELARLKSAHGRAVLWEGHSIRSEVPMLFEGRLPDLNLGTGDGSSCRAEVLERLTTILGEQHDYSWVANARFKGGYPPLRPSRRRHRRHPARTCPAHLYGRTQPTLRRGESRAAAGIAAETAGRRAERLGREGLRRWSEQ
jgi:N-formylglutamate deformylase